MLKSTLTSSLGAALLLALVSQVSVAETTLVKYDDLRLSSESGPATLRARIAKAAKLVCEPLDKRVLSLHELHQQCIEDAVNASLAKIGSRQLPTSTAAAR